MNAVVPALWQVADVWGQNIWWASLVACVAIAAAWAIARWCMFLSPRVVCWIWRLACLKVLVALVWVQPVDLAWLPPKPVAAIVAKSSPSVPRHSVEPEGPRRGTGFTLDASPAVKTRPPLSILAGLLLPVWLVGVVYCMTRTARQWLSVRRLLRASQICAADRLLRMLQTEGQRLGVRRLPRLEVSSRVESPLLVGICRPAIILPDRAEEKFDEAEVRLMITHELAHLKRHDLAWNWLPTVANWLFFFHPLVWVMIRRWSEAAEAACDEVVIQQGVAQPTDYGRLLLRLSATSPFESSAALGAAGVLGAYRNLERRILAMTRVKPFSTRRLVVAAFMLFVAATATIVPWRLVAGEPKVEKEKPSVAAEPALQEEDEQPPTTASVTGIFTPNRPREPKVALDPATLSALKRLKELGAGPAGVQPFTGLSIGILSGWTGTEADLDLIAELSDLKWLYFDLDVVPAEAVGRLALKLKRPVDYLQLANLSDERLTALARLPGSKSFSLGQQTLSAAGFRHLAEMAEGIESFQTVAPVGDTLLEAIGKIRSLKELWLANASITDAGLAHLAGLEKLEKLLLLECRGVRGLGYASLAPVKSLRELVIAGPPIDAEQSQAVAKLSQLEVLLLQPRDLPAAGLKVADVQSLENLKNLRNFFVNAGRASNEAQRASAAALLAVAGKLPSLRKLSVAGVIADADDLVVLASSSKLEEVTLFDVTLSDRGLAALGELENLKQLRLMSKGVVTETAWAKLTGLKQLTVLSLTGSALDDAGLAELANLTALEQLILLGSRITGTGLKPLANLKQLKTLTLANSPFDDDGAEALRGLSAIESLDLSTTKITDRSLDAIATLAKLRMVTLDDTSVTADGLLKLRDLKQLSSISVVGVKLSAEELARLRAAMPEVDISDVWSPNDWTPSRPGS